MDLPKRKNMRLTGYDYSSSGAYFVTICVKNKKSLLWEKVGANCVRPNKQQLSHIGKTVEKEINRLNDIYHNVNVDKYCIMKDHIHIIIFLLPSDDGRTQFAPTVSRIVKQFKGSITKQLGFSIWQKSFYDHIIRSDEGYIEKWNYINENQIKYDIKNG